MFLSAILVTAQQPSYPPGCEGPTFPNETLCAIRNWNLGNDAVDRCAPLGPKPVPGQQVYIEDPLNFCINLPDPNSPTLKRLYYSQNKLPNIVQAEGFVQSFCVGSYKTPGALTMPAGAITSAHVIKDKHPSGKTYYQISGTLDCELLNINCTRSAPNVFDDGGQYDSVGFQNCGKEPYSGVDSRKHPNFVDYVEQAGNGLFCMRVCEAGQQLDDPCNVKNDTGGCAVTMGITMFPPGFSLNDKLQGKTATFSMPGLRTATTRTSQPTSTPSLDGSNSNPTGESTTGKSSAKKDAAISLGLLLLTGLFL